MINIWDHTVLSPIEMKIGLFLIGKNVYLAPIKTIVKVIVKNFKIFLKTFQNLYLNREVHPGLSGFLPKHSFEILLILSKPRVEKSSSMKLQPVLAGQGNGLDTITMISFRT